MKFVQIEKTALNVAFSIYKSCIEQHANQGFYQWDETYPTLKIVEQDINKHQLFGLEHQEHIIAVVAVTDDEPQEYLKLNWKCESPYVVVHRLCVKKDYLRMGIAQKLMLAVEQFVKEKNYNSIRLDTFSLNRGALQFYKKLHYKQIGKVCFSKRTDADYTCFEKEID